MSTTTDILVAHWKSKIPASWRLVEVGDTHVHFMHPRKGHRKMSRKRLGI